jgi:hypothetical protein
MKIATLADEAEYNSLWWSVQPKVLQVWNKLLSDTPQKSLQALEDLASKGVIVCEKIVLEGYSPLRFNLLAVQYKYTWGPSLLQPNIPVAPGLHVTGLPDYNPNPPYPPMSVIYTVDMDVLRTQNLFPTPAGM